MNFRSGRGIIAAAICVILAGCGGGSQISSPVPLGPDGHALKPQLNGGSGSLALPTLYVSGQGAVYAYNLPAPGTSPSPDPNQAPVSVADGYYYQAGAINGVSSSIAGVATNSAGDLVIAQNYSNPQFGGNSCQLVLIPARTGTSPSSARTQTCNNGHSNVTGRAIGVTFTGSAGGATPPPGPTSDDIDVLFQFQNTGASNPAVTNCSGSQNGQGPEVDRYQVTSNGTIAPMNCVVPSNYLPQQFIAGGVNGTFFESGTTSNPFGSFGGYAKFAPSGTGVNFMQQVGAGPIAVAANPTLGIGYRVVAITNGSSTTIDTFKPATSMFGGFTISQQLGVFNNPVTALAVDNNGNVYVGVNQGNGVTKIKVYGPTKTEATNPDYILNNPIRRGNPSASPTPVITGIAIAQ